MNTGAPINNTTYDTGPATQPVRLTGNVGNTTTTTTYPNTHDHTTRDTLLGAGAGATTGHAVLGGLAGHAVGKHEQHHDQAPVTTGHGMNATTGHGMSAAPAGSTTGTTHPSTLDKIEGTIEKAVGSATHNPSMVAQGQAKKAGGTVPATGTTTTY
ncbi:hypothetical protein EXIGLDRAFT_833701 [Exidia glandulosa HHB12029]|uniref:Uncharacterized protein n=1 Tax=Exidia glandulosa HHB12029 TaxID=1314781 RepID=A0A165KHA3_EXIGL|nr:hypothetical protein EXIGLDRAFT_833701 [Exidia glandulosa HHB12029]